MKFSIDTVDSSGSKSAIDIEQPHEQEAALSEASDSNDVPVPNASLEDEDRILKKPVIHKRVATHKVVNELPQRQVLTPPHGSDIHIPDNLAPTDENPPLDAHSLDVEDPITSFESTADDDFVVVGGCSEMVDGEDSKNMDVEEPDVVDAHLVEVDLETVKHNLEHSEEVQDDEEKIEL